MDQKSASPTNIYHCLIICKYVTHLKVKVNDLISNYQMFTVSPHTGFHTEKVIMNDKAVHFMEVTPLLGERSLHHAS